MSKEISVSPGLAFDSLSNIAIDYVHQARSNVLKSVNHEQIIAYWNIGRRFAQNAPLNTPDVNTFYTGGSHGYIDYPKLENCTIHDEQCG